MYKSLFEKVANLPEDTIVDPGHDYGPTPTSTIGEELRTSPYLQKRAFEAWLELP
jgi:glyoxylase-like metal-dependent hydrolase (beta-lactamase superfamily II)